MLFVVCDINGEYDRFDWIPIEQTKSGESFFVPHGPSEFAGVTLQGLITPIAPSETIVLGNKTETPESWVQDLVDNRIGCMEGSNVIVCGVMTQHFLHRSGR